MLHLSHLSHETRSCSGNVQQKAQVCHNAGAQGGDLVRSAACLDSFSAAQFTELQESPSGLLLVLTYDVFTTPDLQTHPFLTRAHT